MQLRRIILLAVFGVLVKAKSIDIADCISGASYLYSGEHAVTKGGIKCQRWNQNKPHKVMHVPMDGGHHNFCRNPDKDIRGTWCYTTDPKVRWDYCEIPKCVTDAVVMWTSVDESKNISSFSDVIADPEFMSQKYDKSGETADDSVSWKNALFKAFDADFGQKLLYFTDVKGNYLGVYDVETNAVQKFLHGMTENIEAISYDWVTKNIYWTDSRMKWVMAAEPALQSYTPVYKPEVGYTPYALEVHSVKRLLIFSTYLRITPEDTGAKIICTDLAGRNEKVLFDYPDVVNVVGLTVDYTEDRIYWTEDIGYGSVVLSSRTDGTDKVQHYAVDDADYHDIAVYSDYIYLSDVHKRYNFFGDLRYHIQVITKRSSQVAHYKVTEKPMGIATYVENELYSSTNPRGPGECTGNCDGICLPTLKGKRKCACSVGYHQHPKTKKCIPQLVEDEFLLVVDVNEGHAHQISLKDGQSSIAPLGGASQITSAAVDPSSKFAFFSDARTGSVSRGILGNGLNVPLARSKARYTEIDSLTGNIFYTNGKTITLSNADGSVEKVIVRPGLGNKASDIKALALDIRNKYLYWTDALSQEGSGKLMRCRFDGDGKEVVLDNLNSPHGVAVNFQTNRLYVVESRKALVFEIPLVKLAKIKSTSVNIPYYKKYNLRRAIKSKSYLLTEIKVLDDIAYIADEGQAKVQKFDLSKEPNLTGFGPAIFYRAASLSIYSRRVYIESIKFIPSPCEKKSCSLCIDMNRKQAKCIARGKGQKKRKNGSV